MSDVESQLPELKKLRDAQDATARRLENGSYLIEIPAFELPEGWVVPNQPDRKATIRFLAPPGFPTSQPDCFWVHPSGLRTTGGGTPQNTNDTNPIPGVSDLPLPHGTWFSWHVQRWNPNSDSLATYFMVIKNRLFPAR